MSLPTIAAVQPILADFEPRLRKAIEAGWADWMKTPNKALFIFPRTRSNAVFDHIARHAMAEFANDSDVRTVKKDQTVKFLFKGQVFLRIKKANSVGLGQNIPTQAVLAFITPQREIPGLLKDVHKIEICYKLDDLATKMERIVVTARAMNRKLWAYELRGRGEGADIVRFPSKGPSDLTPPAVRIRKPKRDTGDTGEE
jgi:hypothetical protein